MDANQQSLSKNQRSFFDRFLVAGTRKALKAFETIFGLKIESSDSSIEIAPGVDSKKLKQIGSERLYVISSVMAGELQGNLHLVMHSSDFKYLGEVMKPLLGLLYLSNHRSDLATLDRQKPDWMHDSDTRQSGDTAFHQQMMDRLTEMGKVLFGVYSEAIYMIYDLHTYHTLSKSLADPDQQAIQQVLSSSESPDQLHLIIENEFVVVGQPIRFWCLISPTRKSFQEILDRIG